MQRVCWEQNRMANEYDIQQPPLMDHLARLVLIRNGIWLHYIMLEIQRARSEILNGIRVFLLGWLVNNYMQKELTKCWRLLMRIIMFFFQYNQIQIYSNYLNSLALPRTYQHSESSRRDTPLSQSITSWESLFFVRWCEWHSCPKPGVRKEVRRNSIILCTD